VTDEAETFPCQEKLKKRRVNQTLRDAARNIEHAGKADRCGGSLALPKRNCELKANTVLSLDANGVIQYERSHVMPVQRICISLDSKAKDQHFLRNMTLLPRTHSN
jgi:hypothetical protein